MMNLEKLDKFVVEKAKDLIIHGFDMKDRCNKIINYKKDNYEFTLERRCFHPDHNYGNNTKYYEDYCVYFRGKIDNNILTSGFYMEWLDNIVNSELVPANTSFNPETGEFNNRKIKIRIQNI
jgi:hypothetical protein